jgi:hypothetical protein
MRPSLRVHDVPAQSSDLHVSGSDVHGICPGAGIALEFDSWISTWREDLAWYQIRHGEQQRQRLVVGSSYPRSRREPVAVVDPAFERHLLGHVEQCRSWTVCVPRTRREVTGAPRSSRALWAIFGTSGGRPDCRFLLPEEASSGHVLSARFRCWIGWAASREAELGNGGVGEFERLEDAVGPEQRAGHSVVA